MKIGVNCRELLSHRMEGICRYIYQTTKQMVLDHPEDEFFFFFDRPYDEQFIFAENVTPIIIGPQARHPLLWYIWFEWSLKRAMTKHKIDVLYSGDTYLSLSSNVPTLLVCHDIAYAHYPEHIRKFHLSYYKKYFPQFHHRADHIVAVSKFTKQDIVSHYGLKESKVTVGYNATPPGFKGLSDSEKKEMRKKYTMNCPYFIFVGSLHPRKNLVRLIKAFDRFKDTTNNDYKLVLVGRFAWKNKELRDTFNTIKFKSDIILTGSIQEGIGGIVAGSDGLFYVSLFEGFGIPVLEGFSSHVPVVTSNLSSMPEVAGDCAILVDPNDETQISQAMRTIADGRYSIDMINMAAKRAKTFTWKRTADHIYDQMDKISSN